MFLRSLQRTLAFIAFTSLSAGLAVTPASAQTHRLTESHATAIRGGSFANANLSREARLATRASGDAEYVRRIVMKFDTQTPIPHRSSIASATLTLTVAGGNAQSRTLSAYRVTTSFEEDEATWNRRKSAYTWRAGGDLGEVWATRTATASVGTQVTFDVTSLVQAAVNGNFGSRYTRVAIVDAGGSSRDSYKEFYSDEAGDASVRPTLTVTLGSGTSAPAPAPQPSTSGTIKFLHWNIHHGVGTDGAYNLDRIATWIANTGANVVSLNEVERYTSWGNEDQPARFAALLRGRTGRTWNYHFAPKSGGTSGQGNLLLTTFAIEGRDDRLLSHTRSVAQIRIVVNGRPVNVFSTHLDADSSSRRSTQMNELKSWMLQFSEQRVVGGDFNTWPSAGEISSMTGTYEDVWAEASRDGTAVAYSGNTAGNTRNTRIDYVFLSNGASSIDIRGAQVFDVRNSSGVMPSDHRPLLATLDVR
jgi:endonuclease/exonuclease/phosphatase family metal-dependent hydrolase